MTFLADLVQTGPQGHRLVELRQRLVGFSRLERLRVGRGLPPGGAQPVDAEPAGELRDPGPQSIVAPQAVEMLVDPREHLLEDVLGVVLRKPKGLHRDRVHVAGEPLDELVPGALVPRAAPGDELGIG